MAKKENSEPYFVNQIKDVTGKYHDYGVTKDADTAHAIHKIITKHFPEYEPQLVTKTDGNFEKMSSVSAQESRSKNIKKVTASPAAKTTAKTTAKPAAKAAPKAAPKVAVKKPAAKKK